MKRKIIVYIIIILILPGMLFPIWLFYIAEPQGNPQRQEIYLSIANPLSNTTTDLEIHYNFYLDRKLISQENITDNEERGINAPVMISFVFNGNFSVFFFGLENSQMYWENLDESQSFKYTENNFYYTFRRFNTSITTYRQIRLHLVDIITQPELEFFGIDLRSQVENYHMLDRNGTVFLSQEILLDNIEKRNIHLESTNVNFIKNPTSYESYYFQDVFIQNFTNLDRITTRINLDFSTKWSRRMGEISIITIALIIELPILGFIDLLKEFVGFRKSKKSKNKDKFIDSNVFE